MDDQLRQFLFLLPWQYNFHYSNNVSKEIRKLLFLSATSNGKYLDRIFTKLSNPIGQLEKDLDWKLSEYVKLLVAAKHGPEVQEHFASHPNRPCSRVFRRGEPIIRCLTCAYDQSCALCSYCYQPSEHEGHAIVTQICVRENGGVCDCGDPEAWKASSKCVYATSDLEDFKDSLPMDFQKALEITFGVVLDFLIDVSINCDMHFTPPLEVNSITVQQNFESSTLDPHKYGMCSDHFSDKSNDKFHLQLYNDQVRHFRDAVQRVRLSSQKSQEFANMVTERVHSFGKAEVIASKDISALLESQKVLSATGLASSIRSEREIFREAMCHEMIVWLSEVAECEFFRLSLTAENILARAFCEKWRPGLLSKPKQKQGGNHRAGVLGEGFQIPKLCSEKHCTLWLKDDTEYITKVCNSCGRDVTASTDAVGSRFQYMMFLNLRLWKAARELLHVMYSTSLVTNLKYRRIMSSQYMEIYTGATDQFLSLDREPDYNIMFSLSMQLFASPRNSEAIIKEGGFISILSALFVFLTSEQILEETLENRQSYEISIRSLRNRRWGQLFLDIGFIVGRGKDFYDVSNEDIACAVCDLMVLFQGRPVIKREKNNHVEYENPDYTTFFNSVLVIYKFGELSALTLNSSSNNENTRCERALSAIEYTIAYLITLEFHKLGGITYENTDIKALTQRKTIMEPITRKFLPASNMDDDNVSFLHPLHSYICSLVERGQLQNWDGLLERFAKVGSKMGLPESFSIESLIFDYPIKTLVLVSQIKCGYWVRNGFTVKSQLHMYKNTGLREYGYMKDLFMIQIFSNMCSPDLVAYMIFDRWSLQGAFLANDSPYDAQTLPFILEECATFFIHLMTENSALKGLSESELNKLRIKREIVHHLCFKPLSYKTLCSCISEKLVLDKRFEIILNEMTNYTKPMGSNDSGVFELKEEYLDEVDPYYFNYTTNMRDDALKFVKERIHKKSGKPMDSVVIEPHCNVDDVLDIYTCCGNVSRSVHFTTFLLKVLDFVLKKEFDKVESLTETVLHLIHIWSLESAIDTSQRVPSSTQFVSVPAGTPESICVLLSRFLLDEKYRSVHAKIRAILNQLYRKYSNLESTVNNQLEVCESGAIATNAQHDIIEEDVMAKKKKLAKLRQQKLLNKFKKQQSKFLEQNQDSARECSDTEMDEEQSNTSLCLQDDHCILCRNTNGDLGPFGIIAHIGKSSTFRNVPFESEFWFLKAFSDSANLNGNIVTHNETHSDTWKRFMLNVKNSNPFGPGFDISDCVESKLTALSCGHGMHFKCYLDHLDSNRARQSQVTRNTPENPQLKEILCPLCKAVNNVFIPIFGTNEKKSMDDISTINGTQHKHHNPIDEEQIAQLIESQFLNFTVPCLPEGRTWLTWLKRNYDDANMSWRGILNSINPITFPKSFDTALPMILCNTIKSSEIALRGVESKGRPVFKQIPSKSLAVMKALHELRSLMQLEEVESEFKLTENALAKTLASILSLSPSGINETIVEADFMDLLVEVYPLPILNLNFNIVLRVTFVGHVIQCLNVLVEELKVVILTNTWQFSIHDVPRLMEVSSLALEGVVKCFDILGGEAITARGGAIAQVLYTMLVKSVTPFLRRAAIYASLQCSETENSEPNRKLTLEADDLCTFMRIPTISQILQILTDPSSWEGKLLQNFASTHQLEVKRAISHHKLEYPGIFRLIDLSERLDNFFTQYYYLEKFGKPYQLIEDPAICLFCGTVVDLQKQAAGTGEGQCTTHYSRECSSEDGMFLLPKDRVMLLLNKFKGSFHSAPYLDDQGELADENKKSKTLHLMEPRYDDFIRNIWLEHNVANYIARNLESVLDPGGWETL